MGFFLNLPPSPAFFLRRCSLSCYNFSITPKPSPGRPWCDIQGIINGNTFLHYCCGGKKVELVGPLGMKLNDTESWERQTETLKDLLEELRKKLLDMKAEAFPHSGKSERPGQRKGEFALSLSWDRRLLPSGVGHQHSWFSVLWTRT